MNNYYKCYKIAEQLHKGQTRKFTGVPYLTHCTDVARITAMFGGDEDQQCIALLHDTVEDCDITYQQLEDMLIEDGVNRSVTYKIVDGVMTLTKRESESETLKVLESADPYFQHVKCADIIANLSDGLMSSGYKQKKLKQLVNMVSSDIRNFAIGLT